MFKYGLSVPGLTLLYLFTELPSNTFFTVFNQMNSDLHLLVKDNIVGGPAIIFHRYHENDVTKTRGEETCRSIVGYEANALYLWALMQDMPTARGKAVPSATGTTVRTDGCPMAHLGIYGDLPDILGFGAGTGDSISTSLAPSTRSMVVRGYSIVDLRRGFESLCVYSSIVEPRIVGDKIAPLLRIVPITGSHREMVTTRFDHVQYIPLLSREFGSVETEIRDDTGRPVPFERGKVMVTLHFRRCSSGLFR